MERNRNSRKLAKVIIITIILLLAAKELYYSNKYSAQLSLIADPFSEANVLRAGEGFVMKGFLSNAGLPDLCYGDQFPDKGFSKPERFTNNQNRLGKLKDNCVYIHYPQLPDLIAGLLTGLCGVGNLGCFRLFPTLTGVLSLALFAWMLFTSIGPVKTAVIMLLIAIAPMTSNMMHGLHYEGYALSLFLIQLGFYINIFKNNISLNRMRIFILFLLGFIQGWLSFDYFFLVSLSAIPFALLYTPLKQKEDRKRLLFALLAPFSGFVFAHFLHMIQVYIFVQDIGVIYNDFFGVARTYSGGRNNFLMNRVMLSFEYLYVYSRGENFFNMNLAVLTVSVCVLIWVKEMKLFLGRQHKIVIKWASSKQHFPVLLSALTISFLWVFIMYGHAMEHYFLLPRHLFLLYLVCILTIVECTSLSDINA